MAIKAQKIVVLLAALAPALAVAETPVTVRALGDLLVSRDFQAPASVVAANRAVVTSQISALIDAIAVDVGDEVVKGQLLVRLDAADANLAVAEAEAELAALDARLLDAQQRLRRAENLLARNFVSEDELKARETDVLVLEANRNRQLVALREARLALARTEVSAPFDAAVVERQGQVGSLATPGTSLVTLVQTADREVDAEIDPRYAEQLKASSGLRFVSEGREWPLELARLSSVIESDTRKLRGRFRFAEDTAAIGSTGELVWNEASGLLPVELIVQRAKQLGVFTVSDGRAQFVAIPAAQEGRPATLDMPYDTPIVTRGHVILQNGDAVQITGE